MSVLQVQAGIGLLAMALLAAAVGRRFTAGTLRVVVAGLALQVAVAALFLWVPPLRAVLGWVGEGVSALARATEAGTSLVFGYLGGAPLPFQETAPGASFILFFRALPLVLVVGALSALLYHLRVLPLVVSGLSRLLRRAFGLSGAGGFAVAANVFLGMVEAPLLVRAWLQSLPRTELFAVMTAGMATISGNTLVVYAVLLAPVVPDAAGQLLVASLVSVPAAVMAALLVLPPGPADATAEEIAPPVLYSSAMEAVVRGTADGLALLLGIMAALIVFVALVALANMALVPLAGLSLQDIAAVLFLPFAFAMGLDAEAARTASGLLGTRIVLNEFLAFLTLAESGGAGLDERARLVVTYALCGFANLGSVGILVAGLSAMAPERRAEISRLGLPAMLAGALACCMTGAVVGLLTPPP
ncbi:MAG: nucleoside transporter C-terminal domain-containing protein [Acetobacteraceae bacterium]|nr:nucleoside transporter C-terminal domain-containing protein [Acetobacteraceae bacterium]